MRTRDWSSPLRSTCRTLPKFARSRIGARCISSRPILKRRCVHPGCRSCFEHGTMSAITARHLTNWFYQKVAGDDTSFEVANGEFLVLVGPSGCGKTTTLRMLAGLEPVTRREIMFGEHDVTNIRAKDRNIAMVFQDYAIFPHMTVYENIAYGLRSRHAPRSEIGERVARAATTFRIDHLLQRK